MTVVPAFTVKVPGVKVKLTMFIVLPEAVVELLVFDVEQLVRPINNNAVSVKVFINTIFFIFISSLDYLRGLFGYLIFRPVFSIWSDILPGIIYVKIEYLKLHTL